MCHKVETTSQSSCPHTRPQEGTRPRGLDHTPPPLPFPSLPSLSPQNCCGLCNPTSDWTLAGQPEPQFPLGKLAHG